jgi:hypothetical protein
MLLQMKKFWKTENNKKRILKDQQQLAKYKEYKKIHAKAISW